MKIAEKIMLDRKGLTEEGPITIVAFGDSVTHGAVAAGEINYETVYWNRLKNKILSVRNYVPVNVINAGIAGLSANSSLARMEKQVLCHQPDLIIVCFGLNDVNESLEQFLSAMKTIFESCSQTGAQVIYMTPNMLNTYVAEDTPEGYFDYAEVLADYQNNGRMDLYIESAVHLAEEMGVTVCDCYSEWKKRSQKEDTTILLANRMNHPVKEMHELFAQKLFDILFDNQKNISEEKDNTLYEK